MCPCSIANAVMFYDSLRHCHARWMRKPMRMIGGAKPPTVDGTANIDAEKTFVNNFQ